MLRMSPPRPPAPSGLPSVFHYIQSKAPGKIDTVTANILLGWHLKPVAAAVPLAARTGAPNEMRGGSSSESNQIGGRVNMIAAAGSASHAGNVRR